MSIYSLGLWLYGDACEFLAILLFLPVSQLQYYKSNDVAYHLFSGSFNQINYCSEKWYHVSAAFNVDPYRVPSIALSLGRLQCRCEIFVL
ncbi:hypothetical protein BDZ97DRAFT_1856243 [Flammula alnicola]|nr:hypothetical protein BDZ97DRAFT_1856243 [Flammula alnicola]